VSADLRLLDTSVLVAVARGDETVLPLAAQRDARAFVTSALAIAELASLEGRGRLPAGIAEDFVATLRVEPVLREDALAGGRLHGRLRSTRGSKASLVDALMLATARRIGARLVTLDGDLGDEADVDRLVA